MVQIFGSHTYIYIYNNCFGIYRNCFWIYDIVYISAVYPKIWTCYSNVFNIICNIH